VDFNFTFTLCIDILALNEGEEEEDEEEKQEGQDEEKDFGRDIPMCYMTQKRKKVDQTQLINSSFIIKIVLRVSACDSHFSTPSPIYFVRLQTFDRT